MAGDGGLEPLNSSLPDCNIIARHSNYDEPLVSIEAKQPAPDYRQALAHALRAVAAAGEALVRLAEALESPRATQGPPEAQQVTSVPTSSANGKAPGG